MLKYNKKEVTRYLALPTAFAAVLLYANHWALQRDQLTRDEIAAHLNMREANPSWAAIKERADSMAYVEALHKRLAFNINRRNGEAQHAAHSASTSKNQMQSGGPTRTLAPVIAIPTPMALFK